MSQPKWGIVFNPAKAGRDEIEESLELTATEVAQVRWYETAEDDGGAKATADAIADGCQIVFASGGDGTVRVVAEGLAGAEASLAVIPQGTGNLLARNLGVPLGKPAEAFRHALSLVPKNIDLVWVEVLAGDKPGKYAFTVMAGLGIDAELMAETKDDLKEKAGWLAYVEAMGRALQNADVVNATVSLDGAEPTDRPAHTIMIGNCGTIQGGVTIFPDAKPDDGKLDLLVLNADSALGWLDTLKTMVWDNKIARLWTKEKPESATTTFLQSERIEVKLDAPVRFQVDGDELGDVTHFTAWIDAGALRARW